MDNNYRVLIVEDDKTIAKELSGYLEMWGYRVKSEEEFTDITETLKGFNPDLVLLDIMLPHKNGFYWCREIRKISKVPIMFISSANEGMNIIMAMDMGGDDFISKPFELPVVASKINALLRRNNLYRGQADTIVVGGVTLNLDDSTVSFENKKEQLSKNEYQIVKLLFENAGELVSREVIMTKLWDNHEFIDDNTLTVNINRIRKKLKNIGVEDFITTRKGLGYKIGE